MLIINYQPVWAEFRAEQQSLALILNVPALHFLHPISIADIGEGRRAPFCRTDSVACCRSPNSAGQFYFPNGDQVPTRRLAQGIYRTRRNQHIRLNRELAVTTLIGVYHCEIPDANGVTKSI